MRGRLAALALLLAVSGAPAQSPTPGGQIVETRDGIVFQKNTPVPRPTPDARANRPADAGSVPVVIAPSHGPTGPAVVDASYVTVRGTVVRIEKGKAITVVDARTGNERQVLLAESAFVTEGIKAGDAVTVRIPFGGGSRARTADRVDVQKAPVEVQSRGNFGGSFAGADSKKQVPVAVVPAATPAPTPTPHR